MNQLQPLKIHTLAALGKGMGDIDGKKVFVTGALPGDVVSIKVTKKKRRYMEAKWTALHEKSPLRSVSRCTHFPDCGGCQFIDVPYDKQLDLKSSLFRDMLLHHFPDCKDVIHPAIPSQDEIHYRNKMEYAFGMTDQGKVCLGLKQRGTFDQVVPLSRCALQSDEADAIRDTVSAFFNEHHTSVWDHATHQGILRYLTVRHSKTHDNYMLILVVSESVDSLKDAFIQALTQVHTSIASVYVSVQASASDTAAFGEITHWYGATYLKETLDHVSFEISPSSFFQTNTRQAAVLYQTIRKAARLKPDETLLDLYCGTGTIGLYCAADCKAVIGIEEHPAAIEDANRNATLNGISHTTFYVGRVKNILKFNTFSADCVVVDPPRSGLVPKAMQRIAALQAPRMVYVSCNPATLVRDLQDFVAAGYQITSIQPVDMFPHTYHLECVAELIKVL